MATLTYNDIIKRTNNLYTHTSGKHPFDVVLIQYDDVFVSFYNDAMTIMDAAEEHVCYFDATSQFVCINKDKLADVVKAVIVKTANDIHIV